MPNCPARCLGSEWKKGRRRPGEESSPELLRGEVSRVGDTAEPAESVLSLPGAIPRGDPCGLLAESAAAPRSELLSLLEWDVLSPAI